MLSLLTTLFFAPFVMIDFIIRRLRKVRDWYYRNRPPPWMNSPSCNPFGDEPGEHNISMVSRHHLAESGLICSRCTKMAAERGDYRGVRRVKIGGRVNEAVVCAACEEMLIACPDTEHGDHEKPDGPEMYLFVRISEDQALAEKYDPEVKLNNDGQMTTRQRAGDVGKPQLPEGIPWDEVAANTESSGTNEKE